jgi:hypothetical protein
MQTGYAQVLKAQETAPTFHNLFTATKTYFDEKSGWSTLITVQQLSGGYKVMSIKSTNGPCIDFNENMIEHFREKRYTSAEQAFKEVIELGI